MTVTVDPALFRQALSLAASAIDARSNIPVLHTLRCRANGALQMESTDLDASCRVELPYIGSDGEFVLPVPRLVNQSIAKAGGETVDLRDLGDRKLSIKSGAFAAQLRADFSSEDHPGAELVHFPEWQATLGSGELRQLARILRAVSTEETRYYLNGVCITKVADWTWRFAATDGHQLMMIDIPLPDAEGDIPSGTILPRRWLHLAMQAFARTREPIRLIWGRAARRNSEGPDLPLEPAGARIQLSGKLGGLECVYASKAIDGTYPDYSRVVPTASQHHFIVDRKALLRAIRTITPLNGGKIPALRLSFATAGTLSLQLDCLLIGKSEIELPIEGQMPKDYSIGFNGNYLLDMANALTGESMAFALNSQSDPAMITDPADTLFRGVIMPMRA